MVGFLLAVLLVHQALATPPTDTNCGNPAVTPKPYDEKIVGGVEATPYSWPWQIQIRYNGGFMCGASILSPDWLVSAAHCFKGKSASGFNFRAGRFSRTGTNEPYEQSVNAQTVIIHEGYSPTTMNNDIVVVRLTPALKYTNQVKAVCLPTRTSELPNASKVYVTGWGATSSGGSLSTNLMQVQVEIIDRTTCNQATWYSGSITSTMICAGFANGGKDSCQGDSGGPLVFKNGLYWELYGVVSWGSGCAGARKPGVYANVFNLEAWVRTKVVQVEREEALLANKVRPIPSGLAFREMSKMLVESGEVSESDLPNADAWM